MTTSASFPRNLLWGALSLAFISGVWGISHAQDQAAQNQEAQKPSAQNPGQQQATVPQIEVPQGPPEQLLKFIDEMRTKQPAGETQQEQAANFIAQQQAIVQAADQVLNTNGISPEFRTAALNSKLDALSGLAQTGNQQVIAQLANTAQQASFNPNPQLARKAKFNLFLARMYEVRTGNKQAAQPMKEAAMAFVQDGTIDRTSVQVAMMAAQLLEQAADPAKAEEAYHEFANVFQASEDPQIQRFATVMESSAKRLGLIGEEIQLAGQTLSGEPLDWASYRGKVVLVDFWATWCGPCRAELPNVKENYAKYKDKGFDVLGISLDQPEDREGLQAFLKEENVEWTNLFSDKPDASGWQHPMAEKFGISSIPATFLVGRDGKVVALNVRGEELGRRLEELVNAPAPNTPPAENKPGEEKPEGDEQE